MFTIEKYRNHIKLFMNVFLCSIKKELFKLELESRFYFINT